MSEKSQELVKGLNKISRATMVFIFGSPFTGSLAFMVFALMIKRFDVMLSYFFMLNELPNINALILIFIGDFLLLGLLKLKDIFEDSKFYVAAVMFAVNILLSFMLSPMAVLAGFAGWIVTYLATRSALKELEQA